MRQLTLLTFTAVLSALGQEPLRIVETAIQASTSGATCTLQLTNQSTKVITAFVLLGDFLETPGGPVTASATQAHVMGPGSHGLAHFSPGTSIQETFNIPVGPTGQPVIHKMSLDYVLFSGGSSWGPNKFKMSVHIQGVISGSRGERARLRQLLKQKGVQAVIDDLNAVTR